MGKDVFKGKLVAKEKVGNPPTRRGDGERPEVTKIKFRGRAKSFRKVCIKKKR